MSFSLLSRRAVAPSARSLRSISTTMTEAPSKPRSSLRPSFLTSSALLVASGLGLAYFSDSRSAAHEHLVMPIIRAFLDAETSHEFAIRVLQWPFRPKDQRPDAKELSTELFGLPLSNPIGLAAGFDKNAEAIDGLFDLGFGYVEIGSVTPVPQPGNPKPRFFRLTEDSACINRYGFNSHGHARALANLQARIHAFAATHPSLFPTDATTRNGGSGILPPKNLPRSLIPGRLLGINLGKNKTSAADSDEDYLLGVRTFGGYADVLVVNVSSPNTPGLRLLQGGSRLGQLLGSVVKERDALKTVDGVLPKVVVKIAPDLGDEEIQEVADAVKESGVDGVIVSNTTISRPESLKSAYATEIGGLSGPPVKPLALQALRSLRSLLPSSTPLIGCGGISSGSDALEFAEAGASAVQLYTSFGFKGVGTAALIKDDLEAKLQEKGETWRGVVRERAGRQGELKRGAQELIQLVAEKAGGGK